MDITNLDFVMPLLTLILLEVILGIDNIIFISVLADRLPVNERNKLRYWGLGLAMLMRLLLLAAISWILKLNDPIFTFMERGFTGKDIILVLGGVFLIYKSSKEVFHNAEGSTNEGVTKNTFGALLFQVIILDLVFSVDSIITAVGMTDVLWIMYAAVIISVLIMLVASKPIMDFISKHPSFKILALCFLMVIGVALAAEGFGYKIPKPFIYGSLAFSFFVDLMQMRQKK